MEECKKQIDMGANVTKFRKMWDMPIEKLAHGVDMSVEMVADYENQKVIKHEVLEKFAQVLEVPVKVLEFMESDPETSIVVENNDIDMEGGSVVNVGANVDNKVTYNNPVEALLKMHEDMMQVYKEMLKVEKEKVRIMEKMAEKK